VLKFKRKFLRQSFNILLVTFLLFYIMWFYVLCAAVWFCKLCVVLLCSCILIDVCSVLCILSKDFGRGLNPRTWVPEASMLTTRPQKPFYIYAYFTSAIVSVYIVQHNLYIRNYYLFCSTLHVSANPYGHLQAFA
jgi:hypothetical protein